MLNKVGLTQSLRIPQNQKISFGSLKAFSEESLLMENFNNDLRKKDVPRQQRINILESFKKNLKPLKKENLEKDTLLSHTNNIIERLTECEIQGMNMKI